MVSFCTSTGMEKRSTRWIQVQSQTSLSSTYLTSSRHPQWTNYRTNNICPSQQKSDEFSSWTLASHTPHTPPPPPFYIISSVACLFSTQFVHSHTSNYEVQQCCRRPVDSRRPERARCSLARLRRRRPRRRPVCGGSTSSA